MTHVHCTRTAGTRKPKVSVLPFAALPHDLVSDTRLTPTDKTLAALIIKFARDKSHAWPSNRRLAAELGRSLRTVQLSLGRLRGAGWLRIEPDANPTGRRLVLAWRSANFCAPGMQPIAPHPAQSVAPELRIVLVEPRRIEKDFARATERERLEPSSAAPLPLPAPEPLQNPPESLVAELARAFQATEPPAAEPQPEPARHAQPRAAAAQVPKPQTESASQPRVNAIQAPAPQAEPAPKPQDKAAPARPAVPLTSQQASRLEELSPAMREQVLSWIATRDPVLTAEAHKVLAPAPKPKPAPQSVPELLARIQDDPTYVAQAAEALARCFNDRKSWRAFHKVCERAWRGELPPDVLVQAWREASREKARKPGAVFNHVLKRECGPQFCGGG
jgi:helix-turn-helix protein